MKKIIVTFINISLFILGTSTQYISGQEDINSIGVTPKISTDQSESISPFTMNLSSIPTKHTIDKTKSIGEIPMQYSMANGALTYNVPIDVYPGSNDMQPRVSLSYNSFSRDGVAGYGWSMGGLSAIYLVNHNHYFDGYTDESKMDKSGAYTLDGSRLINLKTGTGNMINFQTEQGHILATAYLNGNSVKYFQVKYPSGSIAIFGNATNTANDLSYPLTKVEDILGNYIEYKYEKFNNIYYVTEINYGSKKTKIGTLKLSYNNRTNMPTLYTHGTSIVHGKYLKSIDTYFNTQKLRTYSLTYDNSNSLLLKKIDCSNDKGEYLNPLLFYYGDNNNNNTISFQSGESDLAAFWLNGDQKVKDIPMFKSQFDVFKTGLFIFPGDKPFYNRISFYIPNRGPSLAHKFGSIVNEKDGENLTLFTYYDTTTGNKAGLIKVEKGFIDALSTDINGDGIDEIIKINTDNCNFGNNENVTYSTYTITSGGSTMKDRFNISYAENTGIPYYSNNDGFPTGYVTSPILRRHISGNFLGDGKNQVLSITVNKNFLGSSRKSQLNMVCFDEKKSIYKGDFDLGVDDILFVLDYDGDGKAELAKISSKYLSVYSFSKTSSGLIGMSTIVNNYDLAPSSSNVTLKSTDFVIGDLNGDGKTDFLVRPFNGNATWTAHYATNNNLLFEKKSMEICSYASGMQFFLQDVNRDGTVDLIKLNNNTTFSCFRGIKNGTISNIENQVLTLNEPARFVPNNIFQNNQLHQMLGVKSKKIVTITSQQDNSKDNLLLGSINSFGLINKHSYSSINERSESTYEKGGSVSYPYIPLSGDIYLLNNNYTYVDNILQSSNKFKYKGGIIDITGRGFVCYEKIEMTDNIRSRTTTQSYDYTYIGALKNMESPFSSTTYSYIKNISTNKIAQILVTKKTDKDKLKNISVTKTYAYDGFGNPTTQIVDFGDGNKTTYTNTYTNHNSVSLYKLGELTSKTIKKDNQTGSITLKELTEYNNSARQTTSIKDYYNNNLTSERSFAYNVQNELIEEKIKKYSSSNWLSTKYAYDDFGRLSKETNVLGQSVDYVYDIYGRLSLKKDYKQHELKFEYNNWGTLIKTINPDLTVESKSIAWVSAPTGAIYQVTNTATKSPTACDFFDAMGRVIRRGEQRFDGVFSYSDNIFNVKGELVKASLPFKSSPSLWNTYDYDTYGRLTKIESPSGKIEEYWYGYNWKNITSEGQKTTINLNAVGQTVLIEGNEGRLAYEYRPDGQLSRVSVLNDNSDDKICTSFEYDNYGRQIKVIDPSMGIKLTGYDATGNINSEIDAEGNTVTSTYDNFNRITKNTVTTKINNEIYTTDYSYNDDGLLISEIGKNSNPVRRDVTYDKYLRVDTEKETVADGKSLHKKYNYEDGVVTTIVYSSNAGTIGTEKYLYSDNGYVKEKFFNNIPYWKLDAENEFGMPINVTTGKISRVYEYNNFGVIKSRKVLVNGSTIQDLSYEFDSNTGNLLSRNDIKRNKVEKFSYDPINRLESYDGNMIFYDFKGNIISKSNVGMFSYDNFKPYAISQSFESNAQAIPNREQKIVYNGLMRPGSIAENGYTASFIYDQDGQRVKLNLKKNNIEQLTRYYIGGQYEFESGLTGNKEKLYLGGDFYSASSVYVKENNAWNFYHICRDYLGSITHILDASGAVKQELNYDAWGRLRNPSTYKTYAPDKEPILFLGRGYTGHEHMTWFGLINMNARLYDPAIGRFLSPDPDLKNSDNLQNYNRYSYALNNPLKYTDPNGENPLLVFGIGFLFGYASHGYHTGNWGWDAVGSGVFMGTGTSAVYSATNGGNPWMYSGQFVSNQLLSNANILSLGDFNLTLNPMYMFTHGVGGTLGSGLSYGAGINLSYSNENITLSTGLNINETGIKNTYLGGAYHNGKQTYSYYHTSYMQGGKQRTGTLGFKNGNSFSLRWENDVFAQSGDKYRSNAIEIGSHNYFIGTNVYTDQSLQEGKLGLNQSQLVGNQIPNRIMGKQVASYPNAYTQSSPFYVGKKSGNNITRFGVNSPFFGDLFQNGFHWLIGSPYFGRGNYSASLFFQTGSYSPYTLY